MTINEIKKKYNNLLANEATISDSRKIPQAKLELWCNSATKLMSAITDKVATRGYSEKTYKLLNKLYYETEILLARYMIISNRKNGLSIDYWLKIEKSAIDATKLFE